MSCFQEYAKYTLLNILGMIGLSCYILADTYFVAKGLGSDGLTALNLAIPVYSFIHGTGLMLGMGGATGYSVLKGQGKHEEKNRIFTHTMCLVSVFGMLFLIIGFAGAGTITRLLGADETVYSMCYTYLRILLFFAPVFLLNEVLLCFVRNDGAPGRSMLAMLGGSFSNIILDYLFIFCCDMGIFGAVLATGLAPVISLLILSPFLIKRKNQFHFVKGKLQLPVIKYVFITGAPSFVSEISSGVVMMVFNMIILGILGNIGVAAYGIIANLSLVVLAIFTGIAQGIQPIVSKYFGMDNRENMRVVFRYAVCTVVILSGIIYLGMFFMAENIVEIFNSEGNRELQRVAVEGIRLYFTACVFAGFNIIFSIYLACTEHVKTANIISLLRGFLLIIPMAFALSAVGEMTGLWLAFPVTESVVVAASMRLSSIGNCET
ncbi:MAG: MATE family efflux transporter [Clostridium sp.]|nr:MATE family efflux transporter [Clostridium sp.]